jgi:diaminohydroxyphosphoribosylaminopyrimidine deaminase/5-amino-6-(5-phosphoribosylamino)uracil reductase
VESDDARLTPLDALYLQRTYELARRGVGNTAPNPPVGAAVVRDGRLVAEGYHYEAGREHAEVHALDRAGPRASGATLYVSLEPCRHVGRTPPCTDALFRAGVARVVVGTIDPVHHGGAAELRERGIPVAIAGDADAEALVESFVRSSERDRPYVALKMAASLDGRVTSRPGVREQLTSETARRYVRELRARYDAVMVGAKTIRIDDPLLTVRPAHDRLRPYVRIVVCRNRAPSARSRIFAPVGGYAKTIVLAPPALRNEMRELEDAADVLYAENLVQGVRLLRERDVYSVLCEGGPSLAASLLAQRCVDRFYWLIAPRFINGDTAVPALAGFHLDSAMRLNFDRVDRAGDDVVLSGNIAYV